jgi:hypothetical protein
MSLVAPVLASAKHQLIVSLSNKNTTFENTDSFLEKELNELFNIDDLLKTQDYLEDFYITIIANGEAIPYKSGSLFSGIANDQYYYANFKDDEGGPPNLAAGRIFGLTLSDASSLVARSLYYDNLKKN